MDFIISIIRKDFGYVSIPKCVFEEWRSKGFTNVYMSHDEASQMIIMAPRGD